MKRFKLVLLIGLIALSMGMAGCSGDDGKDGSVDPTVVAELQAQIDALEAANVDAAVVAELQAQIDALEAANVDPATIQALEDKIAALEAEIAGTSAKAIKTLVVDNLIFGVDASNFVTATFAVSNGTSAVTGLTTGDSTIYLAGLVPGTDGGSDEWQYWTGVDDTSLVEGPAGTYLLTSNKLNSDAPAGTATQRGIVRMGKTGFNTVVNSYDFAITDPATEIAAGKDVVNDASCKECHGFGVTIHGYTRNDTKTCVVCHSTNYNDTIDEHEADMVTMVHQIHTNKAYTLGNLHWSGHGENWGIVGGLVGEKDNTDATSKGEIGYPGTILNCAKCHNTVAQADNWKTKPTMIACGSCHNTVTFDGEDYTGINGTLKVAHFPATNDTSCNVCHRATAIETLHKPAARDDASQRTVEAVISGVVVDETVGSVTVSFSVTDNDVAKTDVTASGTNFTLAKLVPSTSGTPSFWQSYLSQIRTKDTTLAPVIQGRTESAIAANLTNNGDGTYTYTFQLLNSEPAGDIRNITRVLNRDQDTPVNGPNQMAYAVVYEPTLTHRVALSLSGIKTQPFIDFVPANAGISEDDSLFLKSETRNIVNRDSCNKCHGDSQLHAGIALEYCVGCHNQESYDPFSGPVADNAALAATAVAFSGSSSVELERIVHKIHMGKDLEKGFIINGTHDYSALQYPSGVAYDGRTPNASDCKVCHDESNAAMTEAANWKYGTRACGSCHDSDLTAAHIDANTSSDGFSTCTLCHAPGKIAPVEAAHYGVK